MDDTKASLILTRTNPSGDSFQSIYNKFRFCKNLKYVINALEEAANSGKIRLGDLIKVLDSSGIALSDAEQAYVNKKFCFNEVLILSKFIESLDVLTPKSHAEPDQFYDILPQPYRLISKIVELDILDSAWLEITRRHPEILINSEGKPLSIPRNNNLNNVVPATKTLDSHHIPEFISMKGCRGSKFIIGIFRGQLASEFQVALFDTRNEKLYGTLSLFRNHDDIDVVVTPWIQSTLLSSILDTGKEIVIERVVIGSLLMKKVKTLTPAPNTKKGKEPEMIETIEEKAFYHIDIVDFVFDEVNIDTSARKINSILVQEIDKTLEYWQEYSSKFDNNEENQLEKNNNDLFFPITEARYLKADIIDYGNMNIMLVSTRNCCELYRISSATSFHSFSSLSSLDNTSKGTSMCTSANVIPTNNLFTKSLNPVFSLLASIDSSCLSALQTSSILFSLLSVYPHHEPEDDFSVTKSMLLNFSVYITLEDTMELWAFAIEKRVSLIPLEDPISAPVPTSKGKTAVTAAPVESSKPSAMTVESKYSVVLMKQWTLFSSISSFSLDEYRSFLVLGHRCGMISLWNTTSHTFVSSIGKHESSISAVNIFHHPRNPLRCSVTAGAFDGTLSFYSVELPFDNRMRQFRPSNNTSLSNNNNNTQPLNMMFQATLIDYRDDILGHSVISIDVLPSSTFVAVLYQGSCLALYDGFQGILLGQFVLYSGIQARQNPFYFSPWHEISRCKPFSSPKTNAAAGISSKKEMSREWKYVVEDSLLLKSRNFISWKHENFHQQIVFAFENERLFVLYSTAKGFVCGVHDLRPLLVLSFPLFEELDSRYGQEIILDSQSYLLFDAVELFDVQKAMSKLNSMVSYPSAESLGVNHIASIATKSSNRTPSTVPNVRNSSKSTLVASSSKVLQVGSLTERRLMEHDKASRQERLLDTLMVVSEKDPRNISFDKLIAAKDIEKTANRYSKTTSLWAQEGRNLSRETRKTRTTKARKYLEEVVSYF